MSAIWHVKPRAGWRNAINSSIMLNFRCMNPPSSVKVTPCFPISGCSRKPSTGVYMDISLIFVKLTYKLSIKIVSYFVGISWD